MKKAIFCGVLLCCIILIVACSPSSPGKALLRYSEYMQKGEYDKFIDGMAFKADNSSDEEFALQKEQLAAVMKEKTEKSVAQRGGIKKFEIVSEEITEDGKKAVVTLNTYYGDGEVDESKNEMVLQDGVWKMDLGK